MNLCMHMYRYVYIYICKHIYIYIIDESHWAEVGSSGGVTPCRMTAVT